MKRLKCILMAAVIACFPLLPVTAQPKASEARKEVRLPAVAGSFYPANRDELTSWIAKYFTEAPEPSGHQPGAAGKVTGKPKQEAPEPSGNQPVALVVPHAGYVFSGEVAAAAYKLIDRNASFRHIFIIGPAHRLWFDGVAIFTGQAMRTPLGDVAVDPLASQLASGHSFVTERSSAHEKEHCLEVQLPFLQYWLNKPFSVVPILVGGENRATAGKLAAILAPYLNGENLFIISSDFSHYPAYAAALSSDRSMADAIATNDPEKFLEAKTRNERSGTTGLATAMCGWLPMVTLLDITSKHHDISYSKVLYQNSGDSPYGDRIKVVGYWSLAASLSPETSGQTEFRLTEEDKTALLTLARMTLDEYLRTSLAPVPDETKLSPLLLAKAGCFVTLRKRGELRGCIGNFGATAPLYQTVQEMAVAAAVNDSRFNRVTPREMTEIDIEISVLTPMKKIDSPAGFRLGKDGLYIRKGNRSGTFLPQVADETGWSVEEFFGHCARDKAGLGWEGWKEPGTELFTYQAIVFGEKEMMPAKTVKH